jgi:exonuclease VII small subunit
MLGQAGEMHYKRIKLAKEIIADNGWVLTHFAGDEFRAAEVLEKDYFGDLCGAINFWRLLKIIDEFPKIEDWKKHKFNLTEMSAEIDARNHSKRKKGSRWSITQCDYEELESERNRYHKLYSSKKEECEEYNAKVKQLEDAVARLTREKAQLEKKVAEYEQLIETFNIKKTA